MARERNIQKAIVVSGEALDPTVGTEKLALFKEDGSPLVFTENGPVPPDLSGIRDGEPVDVLLIPESGTQGNAIVVEAPDGDWGHPDSEYGTGQAFILVKEDDGVTSWDDRILARLDSRGGFGLAGGMHMATGLRARPEDVAGLIYSLHIDPTIDVPGLLIDGAPGGEEPLQQWRLDDATVLAEVTALGSLLANRGINVASGDAASMGALTVKRNPVGGNDGQLAAIASSNQIVAGTAQGDFLIRAVDTADGTGKLILAGHTKIGVMMNSTGIAFNGTAPIAKPTGVAVTAVGIHAALVSLGLIAA